MIIRKGSQLLVLRYKSYKNHSFIKEHTALISKYGGVWMLKIGKTIPAASLEKTVDSNGVLILRSPKSEGGQLYICTCQNTYSGKPKADFWFPSYYNEMLQEYYWLPKEGSWFFVTSINPLEQKYYDSLRLIKNEKPLIQVLNETRTVCLYVMNSVELST